MLQLRDTPLLGGFLLEPSRRDWIQRLEDLVPSSWRAQLASLRRDVAHRRSTFPWRTDVLGFMEALDQLLDDLEYKFLLYNVD